MRKRAGVVKSMDMSKSAISTPSPNGRLLEERSYDGCRQNLL